MFPEELSFQLMDPLGRRHGPEAGFVPGLLHWGWICGYLGASVSLHQGPFNTMHPEWCKT